MSILKPGWLKKAQHLRSIVLCSPLNKLPPAVLDGFDAMREFRRGTIGFLELKRRTEGGGAPAHPTLHEPAEIYGWTVKAALFDRNGTAWWLVTVERDNAPSDKDKDVLRKVLAVLGCDDPNRDAMSPGDIDVIASGLTFMIYTWRNMFPLQEIQVHRQKRGKDMMRIVPRGTRPTDGYESLLEDES